MPMIACGSRRCFTTTKNCSPTFTSIESPVVGHGDDVQRAVREHDDWFDEPGDLGRVERALSSIDSMNDRVAAARRV